MHTAVITRARELEQPDRAVIATDAMGIVIYWGPGAVDLYGWTEAEAIGRNILDLTPSELSRAEADTIMERLKRGLHWKGEFIVRGKDGSRFLAEVTDLPVQDAAGTLLGIIGTSRRLEYVKPR